MMDDFGFRINKYLKVALVVGLIDLLVFYVIGKVFNYMDLFHIIINNWKYAFFPILRGICTLEEAMEPGNARQNLAATAEQVFRLWYAGQQAAKNR